MDVFKNVWTCPKNFNVVQNYLKWKEFEEKETFKIFEHGQKFFEHIQNFSTYPKFFDHVQKYLDGADRQFLFLGPPRELKENRKNIVYLSEFTKKAG